MGNVLEVTDATFEDEVKKSDLPVLVDFWAPWCGPCRMVAPTVEALAGKYEGKAKVVKVNVDDAAGIATEMGVRSIPTLMVFVKGEMAEQTVGVQSEDALAAMLDKHIGG